MGAVFCGWLALWAGERPAWATPLAPYLVRPASALVRQQSNLVMGRPVPVVTDSVDDVRAFLKREMDEQWKSVDLPAQVELMAAHGYLPAGLDLRQTFMDLFSSQAAAFYDLRTGVFHNIQRGDLTEALGEFVVVAHELTHAAQDQAVPAQARMDGLAEDDDRQRAMMWVMEGQATLVGNRVGHLMGPPVPGPLGLFVGELETMFMWTPFFRQVAPETMARMGAGDTPPFLLEQLWTPYAEGSRFAWTLERMLGRQAHRQMQCRPPQSTEQLLHPSKYLSRVDTPLQVGVPTLDGSAPRSRLVQGEWALRWLLRQHLPEAVADDAAAGWGGDAMVLGPHGATAWRLIMDSTQDADALHAALAAVPWKGGSVLRQANDEVHLFTSVTPQEAERWHAALISSPRPRLAVGTQDASGGICGP